MNSSDASWIKKLWYVACVFVFLMLKIYTSNFTAIHGFNEITRFIDYYGSDVFSVILFSFLGLKLLYLHPKGQIKNVGYYIGLIVTVFAFLTEYLDSWKCGKSTHTADKIDMIMYIVGLIVFSTIYYFIEKHTKKN